MEKEMSTEVVFNQEHKTRNAKTEAELCAAVSQKFKKNTFQEILISHNLRDSKDKPPPICSPALGDLDPLNLDNEHIFMYIVSLISSIQNALGQTLS